MLQQKSKLELVCVGNCAVCGVVWYEVLFNYPAKRIGIIEQRLLPVKKRRENRINYLTFDVPEGVICSYDRYVCVKPQTYEYRWFKMEDGQFIDLGEIKGGTSSYTELYLKQFVRDGYSILCSNDANIVKNYVDDGIVYGEQ